jgi:transcriptional regulator with XRE-family HTH domain
MQTESRSHGEAHAAKLAALGAHIRAQRKTLHVSATAAAEAAGLSRVTLHRIERGEPSVAMGLYLSAIAALGLELALSDAHAGPRDEAAVLPERLRLDTLPQLHRLAWQLNGAAELTPKEALDLYERNWRHVDTAAMTPQERALLGTLVRTVGGGRLLV